MNTTTNIQADDQMTAQHFVEIMRAAGITVSASSDISGTITGAKLSIAPECSASVWRRADVQEALKWCAGTHASNIAIGAFASKHVAAGLQTSGNLT